MTETLLPEYDFFPWKKQYNELPADKRVTILTSEQLETVSQAAFGRLSFTFTRDHLEHLIKAALSADAGANDRYVCACLLKNADVASRGVLPLCQDTGIANIFAWEDNGIVVTGKKSEYEALSDGAKTVYTTRNLRFSTNAPVDFFGEKDPRTNMPAQVLLFKSGATCSPDFSAEDRFLSDNSDAGPACHFVFCAKGGGSSNKTAFIQGTKATLNSTAFEKLLRVQIPHLGTSACPPYTIAVAAGGLSPEQNLLSLKLATCGAYRTMSYEPGVNGFRSREWESRVMQIARESGYGAQFGGTQFAVDAVVIRLPRHGASCPVSIGVSCSAHRNLRAVVTQHGYYLEKTVTHPQDLPGFAEAVRFADTTGGAVAVDTNSGIPSILSRLSGHTCGERVTLTGKILVARDAAHARWKALIESGRPLPDYCTKYPICYAGPAEKPESCPIGSFGPTTAGRMDVYADMLMSRGAALVTLAKGNRSEQWRTACAKYHAFYLGTPGGCAALIASEYVTSVETLDYPELGMEAVRLVEVKNLPAFILTDDKGDDFYGKLTC